MSSPAPHPYAAFLARLDKPARYLGGEVHAVRKDPARVAARLCLAFPDVYDVGMSHLGTKILYGVMNRQPDLACERVFAPWPDLEAELRARGLPLCTLESGEALHRFDVIGFSLQYELTYTNVLNMLELGGLPLRAAARGDDAPLVLAGGPTATHPETLAPFVDAFFIGEAEAQLPDLCRLAAAWRREGVPRRERLIRLAERFALYVPELYALERDAGTGFVVVGAPLDPRVPARPRRTWIADLNAYPFPDDSPVPFAEAIFDRMAVEIARGCTEGCRFCQAGIIYRPVRERDPVAVLDSLVEGVRKGGYDETSLTCLSTADYSCVTPLVTEAMARLREERVSLSVSSLRAYGLNDELLAEMATMKAQGLTFAPEAGTQRMRDVITKNVTEADITESAHRVFSRGFQRMKLYFMIGLPTETDEDVRGIVETTARVRDIGRGYLRDPQVVASVSTHVPKPHTPFQWVAMDGEAETRRKQALLVEHARALRVKVKMHLSPQSHLEGLFARGDRRVAEVLERAFRLGCRFDGWEEHLRMDLWDRALAEQAAADPDFEPGRYFGTLPVDARLPWDHIDIQVDPDFLRAEYRKALKDRLSPPCGKPYRKLLHPRSVAEAEADRDRKLVCYDCGVACDLQGMKEERLHYLRRMNAWTEPPPAPPVRRSDRDEATGDGAPPEPAPRPARPPQPTTHAAHAGPRHRYRLRFAKLGGAAFLSHLDLIRHLPRVFRRAGVELAYGGGFRPRPELTFGPALALGVPSCAELLEATLTEAVPAAELVAALDRVTLQGLRWLAARALPAEAPGLGRVLRRADFVARLSRAEAEQALTCWASGQALQRVRRGQGGAASIGRAIDVRRSLAEVVLVSSEEAGALEARLGWAAGDGATALLRFGITLDPAGHARPSEVVAVLAGEEAAAGAALARVGLWALDSGGAPCDALADPAVDASTSRGGAPGPRGAELDGGVQATGA